MSWRDKRKTGIALLLVGVAFVGFALLFSLVLPRALQKRIADEMCVSSKEDTYYDQWINITESLTKIYYWHIVNKEGFLYNGETPRLVERGPYVYTTLSRKIDVTFDPSGKVTYKTFQQQKFNKKMTAKLCATCQENDKVSIVNLAYLGLINQVKTADTFSLVFFPVAVDSLLRDMDSKLGHRNATLKQLGKTSSLLQLNNSYNPEFGSWKYNKLSGTEMRPIRREYSVTEIGGLYNALVNASLLGLPKDTTAIADCEETPHVRKCGLFIWMANFVLSFHPNGTSPKFNHTEAERLIKDAFCSNPSACYHVTGRSGIESLFDFINGPLRSYTLWFMDHNNYGLVTTRSQRDLALGYVMDKFRYPPAYPNGLHSLAVLVSYSSFKEAVQKSDSHTLHSCNSSSEEHLKSTWAAYNGETQVRQSFYPSASANELKVHGHQALFFPATKVRSCEAYRPAAKSYEMFIPQLKRRGTLVQEKQVNIKGLKLDRFQLDESLLTANNRTVFTPGLLDMSGIYGFPFLAGFPLFLHGAQGLRKKIGLLAADPKKHGSFIDIEPFTGTALQAVFRFQTSAVVNSGVVLSQFRPRPYYNVSYVDDNTPFFENVIPLFWIETSQVVNEKQARLFRSEVFDALSKMCTVMVCMSIAAGVFLFSGFLLVVLSIRGEPNTVEVELNQT